MPPRISLFPKCYFDELTDGRRSYAQWIREAATLGGEGIEHYDGFFRSFRPEDVEPVQRAMAETGQVSSMLCFSPDFTHPDATERQRQVERQRTAIDLCVALGMRHCRTLSGQRYPRRDEVDHDRDDHQPEDAAAEPPPRDVHLVLDVRGERVDGAHAATTVIRSRR